MARVALASAAVQDLDADRVVVVTVQDARSSRAATDGSVR
jgi:hypothetical protein